ncbi:DNA phosphorothioation-associated putative methyltransferase [Methylobacterium sp.]|uniref:DNA phosphorothioation-associated putative methyltransferase n=1 Tax=Methylobacterium sp. TaxID=409 RepID=UPI00257E1BEA|nr:DNA phosphorothioation-associated putative methyltransferase [Methylobacterium sp.]
MSDEIVRHKTALTRTELSRPFRRAMADGLLPAGATIMDYGCGRGDDVRHLTRAGYDCVGWDPSLASAGVRRPSGVVNLGYVINVIEDPAEREAALRLAWELATEVLVVSARLTDEAPDRARVRPLSDGYVTRLNTFQKLFEQQELRAWIDRVLGLPSVAAAPGIFYVFRDPSARATFLASRYQRAPTLPRLRSSERLFAEHQEVFSALSAFLASRGRLPAREELPEHDALVAAVGSLTRAFRVLQSASEPDAWTAVRNAREQDLLVYLALSRFDRRPNAAELPAALRLDVKAFFGSYSAACRQADELLFSLGRPDQVEATCRSAPFGKLMPDALYVHREAIAELPILLRLYEGCARSYIGSVPEATLVKLKRGEPKVSYLAYPSFDTEAHPTLQASTSVDLRTFRVKRRDYSRYANPPILHRKETFVPETYPKRDIFARLTRLEEDKGLYSNPELIGTAQGWGDTLKLKNLKLRGHRLMRAER